MDLPGPFVRPQEAPGGQKYRISEFRGSVECLWSCFLPILALCFLAAPSLIQSRKPVFGILKPCYLAVLLAFAAFTLSRHCPLRGLRHRRGLNIVSGHLSITHMPKKRFQPGTVTIQEKKGYSQDREDREQDLPGPLEPQKLLFLTSRGLQRPQAGSQWSFLDPGPKLFGT